MGLPFMTSQQADNIIAGGAQYTFMTTSGAGTSQQLKTTQGALYAVIVGNPLTSAMQLFDGATSGATSIAKFNANTSAQAFYFGASFNTGLLVSTGSVLDNITVIYQ